MIFRFCIVAATIRMVPETHHLPRVVVRFTHPLQIITTSERARTAIPARYANSRCPNRLAGCRRESWLVSCCAIFTLHYSFFTHPGKAAREALLSLVATADRAGTSGLRHFVGQVWQ